MAAKQTFEIEFVGDETASDAFVGALAALPAHKWIPIDQIRNEGQALLTQRQADWLAKQVAKKVKGSNVTLTVVAEPSA
jgi:hypothetical protein